MKRGLLTSLLAIAFRTGHLAQRQAPRHDEKRQNRQDLAYPDVSPSRRSEYSNPPPDRVAILTHPLLPPIDIFLYTLTVTSFHPHSTACTRLLTR